MPPERPFAEGPLAFDLLNTSWIENGSTVDWFETTGGVAEFAAANDHKIRSDNAHAHERLGYARQLIEQLFSGDPDAPSAINEALSDARVIVDPTDHSLNITGDSPESALAIEALVNAVEHYSDRPDRIRSCAHDDCVLWFLDTSKGGRRRWCSMERCGNRAKASRHYRRSSKSDPPKAS